jgi:hypothetical protein
MDIDWAAPSNVLEKDELKLDWSEGEDEEEDEKIEADQVDTIKLEAPSNDPTKQFSIVCQSFRATSQWGGGTHVKKFSKIFSENDTSRGKNMREIGI